MHMRVLWAVFVQFILVRRPHCASRPQHWPSRLNRSIQAGESVDQCSYRHSGRTDSSHRCCYECYQRLQFTEDNAEPSFLPGINSLCQFTVPPPGHLCQPHLCGRGLRQRPANQPHAVWGTVNSCASRRFAVHLAASQTFPAPFCPGESRPTTGATPLPQTRPFWLNQPTARQRNKFSERTPWGSNPGQMNC